MTTTKNKGKAIRTEADGTKICDLQAYLRDNYGAFARSEIDRREYEREAVSLLARIYALRAAK